jgi:hypothetical protein
VSSTRLIQGMSSLEQGRVLLPGSVSSVNIHLLTNGGLM